MLTCVGIEGAKSDLGETVRDLGRPMIIYLFLAKSELFSTLKRDIISVPNSNGYRDQKGTQICGPIVNGTAAGQCSLWQTETLK